MRPPLLSAILLLTCLQDAVAQEALPPNMYADTVHAPFLWGVASGDPLSDAVLIWTRPDPESTQGGPHSLTWQVASDDGMTDVLLSGQMTVDSSTDHCARIDVTGLQPATTYYYRFTSADGGHSVTGRTRTAPAGPSEQLHLAVASCSSVYSGWFNAYRRISERDDLDLVIHLGDYIYDFVDEDEQVRVPAPYPTVPQNEEEWRERHRYYLLDPDLRAARQMHPWAVIWDNHDFERQTSEGIQAFYEYVPRRDVHGDIGKAHRVLHYGDLLDVMFMDIEKFRNIDTIAPGEASVLSHPQREWLLDALEGSTARWRVLGNQKMFGGWYSEGVPTWLPIPNDGTVFDRRSWDGYMAERDTILRFIEEKGIDNIMVVSGDVHMSFAMDVSRNPRDAGTYDPVTGNGSLLVEFIPTSISRGNFDEAGVPASIVPLFQTASNAINVHHRYVEFVQHGYGILNIEPDSIVAEWWYSPILSASGNETLAKSMTVGNTQNRWKRASGFVTIGIDETEDGQQGITIFPNPNKGILNVHVKGAEAGNCPVRIMDTGGREMMLTQRPCSGEFTVNTSGLATGAYIIELRGRKKTCRRSFLME